MLFVFIVEISKFLKVWVAVRNAGSAIAVQNRAQDASGVRRIDAGTCSSRSVDSEVSREPDEA